MSNGNTSFPVRQDPPVIVALAIAGAVVVGLLGFNPTTASFLREVGKLGNILDQNPATTWTALISFCVNLIWIFSIFGRIFNFKRQGSRLKALTKSERRLTVPDLKIVGTCFGIGLLNYFILKLSSFGIKTSGASEVVNEFVGVFNNFLIISVSISVVAIVHLFSKSSLISFLTRETQNLPPMPEIKETIVIGAIEDPGRRPEWAGLNKKAVCGNIVFSGSIGSGKSAGGLLPCMRQFLKNFDPSPAILAIDPKGTFIKEALKIVSEVKPEAPCLHMKLGGEVTFNPLYQKNGLKDASFVETAFMLKSAAANFMGGAGHHSHAIWDVLASNLLKNCLIYCAAKFEYFTLKDLYKAVITARDADIVKDLKEIVSQKKFDPEEKFNIESGIDYFEHEFKSLDEKIRSSILITATSFLSQFQEFQANKIFCPDKEDLTIQSMDEVVDQGKILFFDINHPGLARSMGTLLKLLYQQSILKRLNNPKRGKDRLAVLICDEYQDVASSGNVGDLGDNSFTAKGREANAVSVVAFQSVASLQNTVGNVSSAKELLQNFRTRIACHSSDPDTIRGVKELFGEDEVKRKSHSLSETSPNANPNLLLGGFDSNTASLSESVTTSEYKEFSVTGKEISRLKTFEAFAQIYDGIETRFTKLFLKPYFLKEKNTSHNMVLTQLRLGVMTAILTVFLGSVGMASSFPNVCSVASSPQFDSCTQMTITSCMCPGVPPRPCAHFSYYVPQTFIEVSTEPNDSYFKTYPGTSSQLSSLSSLPLYGAVADDDTHSFQAHTIPVPFASVIYKTLPCDGIPMERPCFEGMSEHLIPHWNTGSGDTLQPQFLAWSLSPKACLLKGAVTSIGNDPTLANYPTTPGCSTPLSVLPKFPPSSHSACNGWGTFYPRTGTYNGTSQTAGALMIASRIKSLSTEIFHTTPGSSDEYFQQISPQSSSCFREGQNVSFLETFKNVHETKRLLSQNNRKYLFVVWQQVSCCKDLTNVVSSQAVLLSLKGSCQGEGDL